MTVIDSAMRLTGARGAQTAGDCLRLMDQAGIDRAVVAPCDRHAAVDNDEGNALLASAVKAYPARISGLAVANPWYGDRARRCLRGGFDAGLCGLYLAPARQGFQLTEEVVFPLIAECSQAGKPVYCRMSTPVCAMPLQLAELARQFPRASFVLGHFGWADFAGYDVIPAALQAPNIRVETSCVGAALLMQAIEELGADRLLFGSGFPRSDPEWELEKLRSLNLAADDLTAILSGNARKLWKLDGQ